MIMKPGGTQQAGETVLDAVMPELARPTSFV
jgi:hypothetical protein